MTSYHKNSHCLLELIQWLFDIIANSRSFPLDVGRHGVRLTEVMRWKGSLLSSSKDVIPLSVVGTCRIHAGCDIPLSVVGSW